VPAAARHPSLIDRGGPIGPEPPSQAIEQAAVSTSKPAVSSRFAAAETALGELMSRAVSITRLAALGCL
jgi:hypothetical protein